MGFPDSGLIWVAIPSINLHNTVKRFGIPTLTEHTMDAEERMYSMDYKVIGQMKHQQFGLTHKTDVVLQV